MSGPRLRILSDLHLDLNDGRAPPAIFADVDFDVLVVAGDVCEDPEQAIFWLATQNVWADKPIVFAPGNHEFYGTVLEDAARRARRAAKATNGRVILLDPGVAVVNRESWAVRFVGAPLWADLRAPVGILNPILIAAQGMSDYFEIRTRRRDPWGSLASRMSDLAARARHGGRLLRPQDTIALHLEHLALIERETAKAFDGPTVVVTHHAPSMRSIAPRYKKNPLTPAYVSVLDELLLRLPERGVKLWVHGHVHHQVRYRCGVDVVCNPVGVGLFQGQWENPEFDPKLTIDLGAGDRRGEIRHDAA